jgi:HAD superfamily hydrolase (TIGR01509 family)
MNKSFGYKAVIYDCDGVMFNSLEANCIFYDAIFNHMGIPLDRNDEDVMRIIHTYANHDVLKHFFPEQGRWEKAVLFAGTINYLKLIHLMKIESGLLETLDQLKGRVHLAICTNRSSSMDAVLKGFNLTDYFSYVMTAARASFPKPHPDPLLRILTHYGLEPENALFVGDSALDSQAASAAGVPFVGYRADLPGIARIDNHEEILDIVMSAGF